MTSLSLSSLDSKSMRFGYVVFTEPHSLKKSILTGSTPHKWGDHITHPALALGDDAHAPQRIGMTDRRQGQPACDETPHAIPKDATVLAAPRQRAMPEPADSEPKNCQRRLVHGHSVVPDVSTYNRLQPLALFGDGFVHSSLKLGFHLIQLRLQPCAYRLPQHRESSITPLLHADMCEAQEVERLRFPFSTPPPLVDRMRTELQESRLHGMQFQVELLQAFRKLRPELVGIRFAVSGKVVARKRASNDADVSTTSPIIPYGGFSPVRLEGWLSGSAFPHAAQVKPAPGIPCATRRFASALRALRCHTRRPALCRDSELGGALPCEELSPLPHTTSLG